MKWSSKRAFLLKISNNYPGTGGANLSGGQKQRAASKRRTSHLLVPLFPFFPFVPSFHVDIMLSLPPKVLARVVHSQASIFVLDNVFSALDKTTLDAIFHRLLGSEGLLKRTTKTVVMTTNRGMISRLSTSLVPSTVLTKARS